MPESGATQAKDDLSAAKAIAAPDEVPRAPRTVTRPEAVGARVRPSRVLGIPPVPPLEAEKTVEGLSKIAGDPEDVAIADTAPGTADDSAASALSSERPVGAAPDAPEQVDPAPPVAPGDAELLAHSEHPPHVGTSQRDEGHVISDSVTGTSEAVRPASVFEPADSHSPSAELPTAPTQEAVTPAAKQPSTRTGRIEIPVPSVVRARERAALAQENPLILEVEGLTKRFGSVTAAQDITFSVHTGSFFGVVGPNGAGKTTTLSMITGLLRPSSGKVSVHGVDVWSDSEAAKRVIGVLPDRLRLFDRLTGAQLLLYSGVLQGLNEAVVNERAKDLAVAFGLESALGRLVSDYSAGMQKKIALACAMIHAPKVLVLDEPFEAIDPVSAANVTEILERFVSGGGSVIMSSHSLDLIQRVCDHVAVIIEGEVIAQGTVDDVRDGVSLEERFIDLINKADTQGGLEWLHRSSDSE